jgi:hypothetical protein
MGKIARMRRLTLLAAIAVTLVPAPAEAGRGLLVGVSEDGLKFEPAAAARDARRVGFRAFRITAQWSPGQRNPNAAQLAELSRAARGGRGFRVVVSVYADSPRKAPLTAELRDEYCSFVRNIAAHYQTFRDFVIWNEPNKSYFWQPQFNADGASAAPAAYEALLARCWDALHSLRRDANVIAPATAANGNDKPTAPSNISHSPGAFIRKVALAYRASGRRQPIFDTLGHHIYGLSSAERPWRRHVGSKLIAEGDWGELVRIVSAAFRGTAQPVPGRCVAGRCAQIWYMEVGFQTRPDARKARAYSGREADPHAVADAVKDDVLSPLPAAATLAPDQASQIRAAIELAYCEPYVGAIFNFLIWDERPLERWQSGPYWADQTPKGSFDAFESTIREAEKEAVDCRVWRRAIGLPVTAPRVAAPKRRPAPPPRRKPKPASPRQAAPAPTTAETQPTETARRPKRGGHDWAPIVGGIAGGVVAAAGLAVLALRRRRRTA